MKHAITAMVYDKRGRLLSVGRNSYTKTHTMQAKAAKATGNPSRVFLHAEVAALVKLKDWSRAHKMVITRYKKDGTEGLSKPCAACMHVIRQSSIKLIQHT